MRIQVFPSDCSPQVAAPQDVAAVSAPFRADFVAAGFKITVVRPAVRRRWRSVSTVAIRDWSWETVCAFCCISARAPARSCDCSEALAAKYAAAMMAAMTMIAAGRAAFHELVARASTIREKGAGEETVRVVAMYRGCASVGFATRLPGTPGYRRQAGRYASERRRRAGTTLKQMPKSESSLLSAGRSTGLRTCRCSSEATTEGGNGVARVLRRPERRLLGSAFLMGRFSYCTSVPRAMRPFAARRQNVVFSTW